MIQDISQKLENAIHHLQKEFSKLQVGRANPALIDGVGIEAYGNKQPLKNLANIGVLDAQTLKIEPWDKSLINTIDKAISQENLGLNPQNNGETIMIKIPPLTQERRQELVKVASKLKEEAKVSVRAIRQEYMKKIKTSQNNDEISENEQKDLETNLQKKVEEANTNIDDLFKKKEIEILKI